MRHKLFYDLFCFGRRMSASANRFAAFIFLPLNAFFALYIKRNKIREGVNDAIYRHYVSKATRFEVGKHTYGYLQFSEAYSKLKRIGSFCSIGQNVRIVGMSHPTQHVTTSPVLYTTKFGMRNNDVDALDFENPKWDVVIENDVYIGQDARIMPGVHIGNGAVIGAGALVVDDVPEYAIVGGVPAKLIRYRFPPEIIDALRRIRWWDWDDKKVSENLDLMMDIEAFVRQHAPTAHEIAREQ